MSKKKKIILKHKNSKKPLKKQPKKQKNVIELYFNTPIDEEVENIVEIVDEDVSIEDALVSPLEIGEVEAEVPESISISNDATEDSEYIVVSSSYSDDGEQIQSIQSIRKNLPPSDSWTSKGVKFKCGERIMPNKLPKKSYKNYECAVVISPDVHQNTYRIKLSRSNNETCINGSDWVLASKECKPYISYWESVSPIIKVNR